MVDQKTPKSQNKCMNGMEPGFSVPATPFLKKIGYGTGVSVYHFERSPKVGIAMSPWALKKLNKDVKLRNNYAERLKKESEILKTINHPNIIGFRGLTNMEDGRQVLAMEECTYSLGDLIEKYNEIGSQSFEPHLVNFVIIGVCRALDYLHTEKKILHADIKSYNILIKGDFEEVKLCDFGVSLEMNESGVAEAGVYIGTECWSSPEVLSGGSVTSKSDIFSLGLVIWEMLALHPPHSDSFENSSLADSTISDIDDSFFTKKYGTRPSLTDISLGPEYSDIIHIFNWCTEEEMSKRPTAREILQFLKLKGIEEG